MFSATWLMRVSKKQTLVFFTIVAASLAVVSSAVVQEDSHPYSDSLQDNNRIKRTIGGSPEEHSVQEDAEAIDEREKKIPRGFLGLRGKKAPSSFLGLRGRRSDSEEYSEEDSLPYRSYEDVPNTLDEFYPKLGDPLIGQQQMAHSLELFKRAPSGFLGMRGKKAPSGFLGMRGKKVPSSFLGLRGKKAPSGFLGMRGKKDDLDYEQLESVLEALRHRYNNGQDFYTEDKRVPRGFLGLRGKKSSPDFPVYDPSETDYYRSLDGGDAFQDHFDKRIPTRFLGLRG